MWIDRRQRASREQSEVALVAATYGAPQIYCELVLGKGETALGVLAQLDFQLTHFALVPSEIDKAQP
jgi:hypothetical protein